MKVITFTEAINITPILPDSYKRRKSNNQEDWGDNDTINAMLKRRGKAFNALNIFTDFAIYVGNNVIGIIDINRRVTSYIQYDSEQEMKKDWILD